MTKANMLGEDFMEELGLSWDLWIRRIYIGGEVRGLHWRECERLKLESRKVEKMTEKANSLD